MARYQIVRKLATGGMAEVFLGRAIGSSGFQKPVAIKRILPHLAADKEFVTRFHDEARLTVHLQHANVVQVFDLGHGNGDHLMVLEFVDGDTLRAVIKEATANKIALPYREMAFAIQQVAEGLAYAHEVRGHDGNNLNIVHRDINPANVMVSSAGAVKLADFGIARAAMAQSNTATGVVRGKIGYFAPEVARGADPDQRSDVFLMGLMLYEVFAGKRLFKEADFVKSLVEVGHFDIRHVKPPEGLPLGLWNITASSLHQDPEQRMPSARQLAHRLSSFLFENRLQVGPSDLATLFGRVFPQRRSALLDDGKAPIAEIDLSADELSSATPSAPPATDIATRTGAIPLSLRENDFALPSAPPSRPQPIPKATQGAVTPHNPLLKPRPPRLKLGELLVHHKLISQAQLDEALLMQKRVGGRLGDVLVTQNLLTEDDLYAALAEQRGHRYVRAAKLEKFELPDALKGLLTPEVAQRLQVLPLSIDEKRHLFIAMVDPADLKVLDEVRSRSDVSRVTGVMIRPKTLEAMIERIYFGRVIEAELPAWVGEQSQMLEQYGATTSDRETRSREQVFGEADLGTGSSTPSTPTPRGRIDSTVALPSVLPPPSAPAPAPVPASPSEALDPFILGAAAREDPLGTQAMKLGRLIRGTGRRASMPAAAIAALEKQALALFMAGQLEHRRPYEPPHAATVKQLLGAAGETTFEVLTAEKHATAKLETVAQQVLAAVFTLGLKLGDLDAPAANAAAALVEVQKTGRVPIGVLHALSAELSSQPVAVAIVAAAGSPLFALVPALSRSGHRVVTSTRECFERARAGKAIIDATLHAPSAIDVVQRAVKVVPEVLAVAPASTLPLIAAWKALGVTTLAGEDLRQVVAWVEAPPKR